MSNSSNMGKSATPSSSSSDGSSSPSSGHQLDVELQQRVLQACMVYHQRNKVIRLCHGIPQQCEVKQIHNGLGFENPLFQKEYDALKEEYPPVASETCTAKSCGICLKSFKNGEIHRHMRSHVSRKWLICSFCGHGSNTMSNIEAHYRKHTQDRPHGCPTCAKDFKSPRALKEHLKTHD